MVRGEGLWCWKQNSQNLKEFAAQCLKRREVNEDERTHQDEL